MMIPRVTTMLVSIVAFYLSTTSALNDGIETFSFDAGTGRRAGLASLEMTPDVEGKRTDMYFLTQ